MFDLFFVSFVAAIVILAINAYFGLHVIRREIIFADLAFAQIAAVGSTIAFLAGAPPDSWTSYLFAFGFTLLGALLFSFTRFEDSLVSQEAIIGVSYVVASAVVILLASFSAEGTEHVKETLTGALIWVTWPTVFKMAVVYVLIGAFHYVFRRRMLAVTLTPDEVARPRLWDFVFYVTFGIVITFAVPFAGVLLIFSTLVIPAMIGFMFSSRFSGALVVGWVSGTIAIGGGLALSFAFDLTTGPVLVCAFGGVLLLAAAVRGLMPRAAG